MAGRYPLCTTNYNPLLRVAFNKKLKWYAYQQFRCYHEVSYPRHGKDPKEVLSYRSDPQISDRDPPLPFPNDATSFIDYDDEKMVRVEMVSE